MGKIVDGKKYLTWDQCKNMQESNLVEIFSHSSKHLFYNRLPLKELRNDLKQSYKEIEKHLGKQKLKVFAYPYGAYTKRECYCLKIEWN